MRLRKIFYFLIKVLVGIATDALHLHCMRFFAFYRKKRKSVSILHSENIYDNNFIKLLKN